MFGKKKEKGAKGAPTITRTPAPEESVEEIIDLVRELGSDGDLSDEDIDAILNEVEVKELEHPFTHKQLDRIQASLEEHTNIDTIKKVPTLLRVFGFINIISAIVSLVGSLTFAILFFVSVENGGFAHDTASTVILLIVEILSAIVTAYLYLRLGLSLLKNNRHKAAQRAAIIIIPLIVTLLSETALYGITAGTLTTIILIVINIVLYTVLDPLLRQERKFKKRLRTIDTKSRVDEDILGRDETGKGYIRLDFFNIFWVFVVCCVIGLCVEYVYTYFVDGFVVDRAGLMYGPFSPIYGFGGLLMTLALNRFHSKPIIIIFLVAALIGGAFEYFVSWFMEIAWGATAWDYSNEWLSINGRTDGMHMIFWGALGVLWVKLLLPLMLKGLNLIPWKWRYSITTVCAVLMIINGAITVVALDCWFERVSGKTPVGNIDVYFAENYDDETMKNRFQTMTIKPSDSFRIDVPASVAGMTQEERIMNEIAQGATAALEGTGTGGDAGGGGSSGGDGGSSSSGSK